MPGVYPNSGVAHGSTTNGVDVATTNVASELFYSTNACQPRFDPASMNAVISEILNASTAYGDAYNGSVLTNLRAALLKGGSVPLAATGVIVRNNGLVRSTDGYLFSKCTAGDITLTATQVTAAQLTTAGLCQMGLRVITSTSAGTDSFGNAYPTGAELIRLPNGNLHNINNAKAVVATATGTDSFGKAIAVGNVVLTLPSGQTVNIPAPAAAAGAQVVSGTADLTGAAPAGALWGINTSNNKLFKVVGGNWVEMPGSTPEVISGTTDLSGAAPTGAKWGINTSNNKTFKVVGGNWVEITSAATTPDFVYASDIHAADVNNTTGYTINFTYTGIAVVRVNSDRQWHIPVVAGNTLQVSVSPGNGQVTGNVIFNGNNQAIRSTDGTGQASAVVGGGAAGFSARNPGTNPYTTGARFATTYDTTTGAVNADRIPTFRASNVQNAGTAARLTVTVQAYRVP